MAFNPQSWLKSLKSWALKSSPLRDAPIWWAFDKRVCRDGGGESEGCKNESDIWRHISPHLSCAPEQMELGYTGKAHVGPD